MINYKNRLIIICCALLVMLSAALGIFILPPQSSASAEEQQYSIDMRFKRPSWGEPQLYIKTDVDADYLNSANYKYTFRIYAGTGTLTEVLDARETITTTTRAFKFKRNYNGYTELELVNPYPANTTTVTITETLYNAMTKINQGFAYLKIEIGPHVVCWGNIEHTTPPPMTELPTDLVAGHVGGWVDYDLKINNVSAIDSYYGYIDLRRSAYNVRQDAFAESLFNTGLTVAVVFPSDEPDFIFVDALAPNFGYKHFKDWADWFAEKWQIEPGEIWLDFTPEQTEKILTEGVWYLMLGVKDSNDKFTAFAHSASGNTQIGSERLKMMLRTPETEFPETDAKNKGPLQGWFEENWDYWIGRAKNIIPNSIGALFPGLDIDKIKSGINTIAVILIVALVIFVIVYARKKAKGK